MTEYSFFASCPKGLENLLDEELRTLGGRHCRVTAAGVYFEGPLEAGYRACLWSRLANRVLLPLGTWDAPNADALYAGAVDLEWEDHLAREATFAVDFIGTSDAIRNSQFGAMRVKDAIVDRLRQVHGQRPNVDLALPDLRVNVHLAKNRAQLSLDLSGTSLHRRGYRTAQGAAPLKENLAAAILLRAGWPEIAARGGPLLDPMCGSGTFLIEAAWMAADIAPGWLRAQLPQGYGVSGWVQHQPTQWQELVQELNERRRQGLARGLPEIRGYDRDPRVLDAALGNVERAGVEQWVRVSRKSISEFKQPTHKNLEPGLMICNPPYGERLGEVALLEETYRTLGQVAKDELPGWQLGVFSGNPQLARELRLRPKRRNRFFNGPIASELLLFDLLSEDEAKLRREVATPNAASDATHSTAPQALSEGAQMVANRLRKNRKRLNRWLQREGIECFRLYDADMPEYAAAIDVYGDRYHLQEYAPPKTVDEQAAQRRWDELVMAAADVCDCAPGEFSIKKRQRNRGKQQYEKLGQPQDAHFFPVREGMAQLLVNLDDYLDTGLFLDHRPLRRRIGETARGKSFLNLFCYTATASVHAALGGASESVSVDMSRTYLDWARKNFAVNQIDEQRHQLEQADCLEWLRQCRRGFDLIMLDPPSFSNSKRMEAVLDVQRDHVSLIKRCVELLTPGGVLYFSTNLRSFKLDREALASLQVSDITVQTLDPDFAQNPKIHQCFEITTG